MDQLDTPRQVITALGGIKAVAKLTGRGYHAAANWNRFPKFPANTFHVMSRALERRGLAAPPSLWGQHDTSDPATAPLPVTRSPRRTRQGATVP